MLVGFIELNLDNEFVFYEDNSSEKKQFISEKFDFLKFDNVYFIINSKCSMLYKVTLPSFVAGRHLNMLLLNELSYQLPIDTEDIVWAYKKIDNLNFYIEVLKKDVFYKILELAAHKKILFDNILPYQLYNIDSRFKNITNVSFHIPKEFCIKRYKFLKLIYFFNLVVVLALLSIVFWGKYKKYENEISKLNSQYAKNNKELQRIKSEINEKKLEINFGNAIQKSNIALYPPMLIWEDISKKLPEHMWVSNYTQNGNIIDLTIVSQRDEINFYKFMGSSKYYQIINLRKSRGLNNTIIFYLKIKAELQ